MFIRPATAADRAAILALMRPRDYNRVNLRPDCFLVAEDGSVIIGIGQIKRHRDGTPELASLVVAPARRGEGIGQALVRALVARHQGPLYLFCLAALTGFYADLGFHPVARHQLPLTLAFIHAVGNTLGRFPKLLGGERLHVVAMKTIGLAENDP